MVKLTKFEIFSVVLSCLIWDIVLGVASPSIITLKAAVFSTITTVTFTTILQLKKAHPPLYWIAPVISLVSAGLVYLG